MLLSIFCATYIIPNLLLRPLPLPRRDPVQTPTIAIIQTRILTWRWTTSFLPLLANRRQGLSSLLGNLRTRHRKVPMLPNNHRLAVFQRRVATLMARAIYPSTACLPYLPCFFPQCRWTHNRLGSRCTATYFHTKFLTHCQIVPRIYPNSPNVHLACKRFQIFRSVVKKSVAEMSVAAASSLVVQLHNL